ncbi:GTPase HflX, partial [Staphylococcus aureus]|nr:GTPase HflX [Staphylococcus aureus]
MAQQQIHDTKNKLEKAVLVGVHAQDDKQFNFESTMEELSSLSETCQLEVLGQITQNRDRVDRKYYVGKGKIEEIQAFIEFKDIDVVITNDELTTAQSKSLNEALGVKIIDRTQLILEIFALRARSKEGKLQVELAQLDYLLPRLQGHGKSLSRLGGGIGTRGPGETKLEMDRRHIRTRMNEIKHQLRTVEEHRERYRNKRNQNQVFQVALVGYTNAGKSSWFNVLANEETYEKDQLFATLDPKTRQIQINDGFNLIISDTVGFIQKLPTTLIAAFKSTLEEAKGADLLVHVVDSSHPEYRTQYDTVNDLIKQLDMSHISQIVIFNKKDLCDHASNRPASDLPNVFVSSKND